MLRPLSHWDAEFFDRKKMKKLDLNTHEHLLMMFHVAASSDHSASPSSFSALTQLMKDEEESRHIIGRCLLGISERPHSTAWSSNSIREMDDYDLSRKVGGKAVDHRMKKQRGIGRHYNKNKKKKKKKLRPCLVVTSSDPFSFFLCLLLLIIIQTIFLFHWFIFKERRTSTPSWLELPVSISEEEESAHNEVDEVCMEEEF